MKRVAITGGLGSVVAVAVVGGAVWFWMQGAERHCSTYPEPEEYDVTVEMDAGPD